MREPLQLACLGSFPSALHGNFSMDIATKEDCSCGRDCIWKIALVVVIAFVVGYLVTTYFQLAPRLLLATKIGINNVSKQASLLTIAKPCHVQQTSVQLDTFESKCVIRWSKKDAQPSKNRAPEGSSFEHFVVYVSLSNLSC
jgi:hypothetical protein